MSKTKLIFGFIILTLFVQCYSFTGSSLTDEKTVQINEFPNNAALVNPALSQQFSTDIQNRFLQRTTLKGTKENPDILIEGEITDYSISPTTISSTTTTTTTGGVINESQNKLIITVKVHYENKIHPDSSFDRTYSDEAVFNNSLSQSDIENSQVKIVTDRIINKIFNDIVANW
ncbi:LPS assembly lipoprotein LptE [Chryseobacterium fluminis]|uniref:LPS assembly lipoprotein LptE n=1 Tax=Chryseobacterium fluminis TaxID=2983606 RepID=UPI00225B5B69|nr:LPS assembly lipoprotein LptE [Chryseobacterium sp. MMS21-Ot14]UZT96193.1 LPS assembly lipoprotein LptE [Chryseobacterium sp. MMS21-Ot14]